MGRNLSLISDDTELIRGYERGDTQALGVLYEKYFRKVFYKCFSFSGDPDNANDLAQDIMLKAFEHLKDFKGKSRFSTWLYVIATNHCIEYVRRKSLFQEVDLECASECSDSDLMNNDPEEEVYFQTLDRIPPREKEILHLKYMKNQTIKELQEKYHVSASAIKMRLKRAREKAEETCLNHSVKVV